jgi:hypothetical protein
MFAAAAALLIARHEMWRDEIQTWLLIRDVGSFKELLSHLKNELHPFLWYALLYPLKFVTRNPEIIKPLHLLIASTTVYLFCRNAPFSRLNKLLFIFGYFPFFEYAIIARDYSLILLFSVLLSLMYTSDLASPDISKTRLYRMTVVIFFICQTHLLGIIVGGVFAFLIAWDVFWKGERRKLLPLFGFLAGASIFIVQIFPPTCYYTQTFGFTHNFLRMQLALLSVWRGFFPLPVPFLHFWNSNILDISRFLYYLQHFLAFFVLLGSIAFVLTLKELRSALFYCLGAISILSAIYVTGKLGIRFPGIIFIIFILALWIGYGKKGDVCRSKVISLLLLIHVAAASISYYYDMKYPFSAAKQTAKFIENLRLRDPIIVAYADAATSPIAGYLNDRIYYAQANRFGSFITWDKTSLVYLTTCEIFGKALELRTKTRRPVLVVLNYMPREEACWRAGGSPFALIGWFPTAIVANEVYSIWITR